MNQDATSNLKSPNVNRPRSNPNGSPKDGLDFTSKPLSLPSSPIVREQPRKLSDQKLQPYPSTLDSKLADSKNGIMPFLEGFRQTLKPKSKSDEVSEDREKLDLSLGTSSGSSNKSYLETSLCDDHSTDSLKHLEKAINSPESNPIQVRFP